MTPDVLTDALRKLEAAGWPVFVLEGNPNVILLEWPDRHNLGPLHIERQFHQAVIKGWLEIQVEARGYRREVRWIYGDDCAVQICDGETGAPLRADGNAKTELEALLEACEAVANG